MTRPRKKSRRKRDSNAGPSALEVDALTTRPTRRSVAWYTWACQNIIALIASKKEEWRKEAADIPPCKVGNDLCSTRQKIGTVSRATLGKLLRGGAERIWTFPSAMMLS